MNIFSSKDFLRLFRTPLCKMFCYGEEAAKETPYLTSFKRVLHIMSTLAYAFKARATSISRAKTKIKLYGAQATSIARAKTEIQLCGAQVISIAQTTHSFIHQILVL